MSDAAPLGVRDAAAAARVSTDSIRRAIRGGHLAAYQPAGLRRILIERSDLDEWRRGDRARVPAPTPGASARVRSASEGRPAPPRRPAQSSSRRASAPGSVERLVEIEAEG